MIIEYYINSSPYFQESNRELLDFIPFRMCLGKQLEGAQTMDYYLKNSEVKTLIY